MGLWDRIQDMKGNLCGEFKSACDAASQQIGTTRTIENEAARADQAKGYGDAARNSGDMNGKIDNGQAAVNQGIGVVKDVLGIFGK